MFSEIAPTLTNAALAAGLLASTLFMSNTSARISALSYDDPLFNCRDGIELYKKIQGNSSIGPSERKELINTLAKEMPKQCSKLTSKLS